MYVRHIRKHKPVCFKFVSVTSQVCLQIYLLIFVSFESEVADGYDERKHEI